MSWAELERRKYGSGGRILLLLTQLRQMWQRRSGARTPNVQWIVADNSDMATTHVCDVNRLLISLDSDWGGTLGHWDSQVHLSNIHSLLSISKVSS